VTLRWRIALLLAAVALAVGAFAASASYLRTASQLRAGIDDTLRSAAAAVNSSNPDQGGRGGRGGRGDDGPSNSSDCPAAGAFETASAAQLVSSSGTVTPCIAGGPSLPVSGLDLTLSPGAVNLRTVDIDGQSYRLLSTPWHAGGTLQVARSLSESDGILSRLRLQLAAIVGIATAAAAGLGWLVATRLVRPIVRLRDATHQIATTLDLSTPIDVGGAGEVGSLASSFSTMVAEVGRSQDQQRRLVSDASHEMRTPLTSLRSNVELLRHIELLPEGERHEVIDDVLADIDELSELLGELVELASDLAAAEPEEPVRLGDLARAVAIRTERRTGRIVTVDDTTALEVLGRPRQLERAISNLVDNAVKYSEATTPIDILVEATSVTVGDRGRGIGPDDAGRIFDRFYRAVDVRTESGSGLGLSIVEEIARSHGGSVFARNREGGGAQVGFTLPPERATSRHRSSA
jgi:two-component system sensor histidine kinase MprB